MVIGDRFKPAEQMLSSGSLRGLYLVKHPEDPMARDAFVLRETSQYAVACKDRPGICAGQR